MSMKRRNKYVCEECNEYTFFSTYRMTSRSLPRCSFCGSSIRVLAQVSGEMPVGAFPIQQKEFFSPDLAQKISESVRTFQGQDVNELFKK